MTKNFATNTRQKLPWYKNILDIPLFHWLVRLPVFPYIFQFGALCFLGLLIYFGWGRPVFEMNSAAENLYRKLNFTTFAVWGLWWTSMIWIAFFIGRLWCQVCPLELVMNLAERLGRRLGIPQKLLPKLFRNGALIVLGYLIVQFVIAVYHIHRAPQGAAIFLISLIGMAFIFGLLFKYRSFCSYVCPVGVLLNCYARNAPFELRIISKDVCEKCTTKDCRSLKTYEQWNGRGCPSLLNPPRLDSNKDCLLCTQCVKACPHDNFRFGTRKFYKDIVASEKSSWAIPLFIVIIFGFLTYELTLNQEFKALFLFIPHWTGHVLGIVNPHGQGFLKGLWMLIVFPAAIWLSFAGLFKLFSRRTPFSFYFKTYAISFIPLLAAAHLSKALDKWNGWLKGIGLPFTDPTGESSFQAIFVDQTLPEAGKIMPLGTLKWLLLILLIIGTTVTLIKIVQTNRQLNNSPVSVTLPAKFIPVFMACFMAAVFLYNVLMW